MNRRAFTSLIAVTVCSAFAFLTGCGSSSNSTTTPPPPTISISVGSGSAQSATVGTAFASALVAKVTTNGSATSGATVTFAAPSTGASCALSATSATTDANGNATVTCTANSTSGAYNVTASTAGATSSASFSLTNNALVSNNYVFYASGWDANTVNPTYLNYYAIVGVVTIDANGNVLGGEENYNDGFGVTSGNGAGTPDTISAVNGALVTDPTTGLGTLTLTTNNTLVGVNGVETFAVQFVNSNHAFISQFDGTATSSGSFDLQSATGTSGNFAFTFSGIDANYFSVAYGGIFNLASNGNLSGTIDVNDDGTVALGSAVNATTSSPDAFGAGTITGITDPATGTALTLNYYIVGPEVIRIIDVDTASAAVGSSYGQGTATFSNASLGSSVFAESGQWTEFASLGEFTTDSNGSINGGFADENDLTTGSEQTGALITGTYTLTSSGYGSAALTGGGEVSAVGVYMIDPMLNINDPNNTTTDLGGALILDLDSILAGGTGVIVPQTDTSTASFNGNYAAGFQNYNTFDFTCSGVCESDMVGPMTMASGVLSTATIGADISDPFGTFTTAGESTGNVFDSTPLAVVPGAYEMSASNTPSNPLNGTINGASGYLDADIYQASGTQLYWLNWDASTSVFLGPIEQQGSLAGMPALKKPGNKPLKQDRQSNKRFR